MSLILVVGVRHSVDFVQVQHVMKTIDTRAERIQEELDACLQIPIISSKTEKLASNQPKLSTMYDTVRKEREKQKEILALMHSPQQVTSSLK